ncbi:hypothetical protein EFK50_12515 [Nocardioides marmoriginsengisoli]|uniref:Uncharacterized protein n=1 Tax=Nocardioides marmoriginsengisoli TaxID=661483 RepID=A0A3N0CH42_9ACTN|nr:hypothetical protein [Nocardioides marmoriginsengisoli]RNL62581.1 hypothetical protein EFK50_12515 [Nocardioides marmoriginsengisoli]
MSEQTRRRRWITPGTVLGGLALVVASVQPAQAIAERLGAGSVGTRELKTGAVTTPKLRASAVTGAKVRDGSLGTADLAASARPRLPRAYMVRKKGFLGDTVNTLTNVATISLPAGTWMVTAKVGTYLAGTTTNTYCTLDDGFEWDDSEAASGFNNGTVNTYQVQTLTLMARPTYTSTRTIALKCMGNASTLGDAMLVATEVVKAN